MDGSPGVVGLIQRTIDATQDLAQAQELYCNFDLDAQRKYCSFHIHKNEPGYMGHRTAMYFEIDNGKIIIPNHLILNRNSPPFTNNSHSAPFLEHVRDNVEGLDFEIPELQPANPEYRFKFVKMPEKKEPEQPSLFDKLRRFFPGNI